MSEEIIFYTISCKISFHKKSASIKMCLYFELNYNLNPSFLLKYNISTEFIKFICYTGSIKFCIFSKT